MVAMLWITGVDGIPSLYFNWNYKCVYCDFCIRYSAYTTYSTHRMETTEPSFANKATFIRILQIQTPTTTIQYVCIQSESMYSTHLSSSTSYRKICSNSYLSLSYLHSLFDSFILSLSHSPSLWIMLLRTDFIHCYRFYHRKF